MSLSVALHFAAKGVVTLLLLLVIALSAIEIVRLWMPRAIGFDVFRYFGTQSALEAQGRHFTELVRLRLEELAEITEPSARATGGAGAVMPSTDLAGKGLDIALPLLGGRQPPFKLDIQGVEVTSLMASIDRWLQRPYAIGGTVWELGGGLRAKASLSGGPGDAPLTWQAQGRTADETSARLACQIAHHFLVSRGPSAVRSFVETIPVSEFCAFDRAWRSYRTWVLYFRGLGQHEEAREALAATERAINDLTRSGTSLPYVHKLASLVRLAQGDQDGALKALASYEQLLTQAGLGDPDLPVLRNEVAAMAAPAPTVASARAATELDLRSRLRPVVPGASLSSLAATAGTVCCAVRDASGRQLLLSAEHALPGRPGTPVLQPGRADGGTEADTIGTVLRLLQAQPDAANQAAGALVELAPGIVISNEAPGLGAIRGIAEEVAPGQPVRALGRTSGLVQGTVTAREVALAIATGPAERVRFTGLIQTTPISGPGDSGAPVVDEQGRLIGFIYAGSTEATIVMPIRPVLDALGVTLQQ